MDAVDEYYANGGSGTYDSSKPDFVDEYYFSGGSGTYDSSNPNPDIDAKDVVNLGNISKTNFGDTLGKVADGILKYGNSFASLLTRIGVIKNPSLQLSADNVDLAKAKLALAALNNREAQVSKQVEPPVTPPPSNSTFFGIDFSNGLNIALLVLGLIGLWMLISKNSNQNNQSQSSQQQQQRTIKRSGQRRVINV